MYKVFLHHIDSTIKYELAGAIGSNIDFTNLFKFSKTAVVPFIGLLSLNKAVTVTRLTCQSYPIARIGLHVVADFGTIRPF